VCLLRCVAQLQVVKGEPQDIGDQPKQSLRICREFFTSPVIDNLNDPQEGTLVKDGLGEHLDEPVARILVPGRVVVERLVYFPEFLLVGGIVDVDAAPHVGDEARDAAVVDGQAGLLDRLPARVSEQSSLSGLSITYV